MKISLVESPLRVLVNDFCLLQTKVNEIFSKYTKVTGTIIIEFFFFIFHVQEERKKEKKRKKEKVP